MVDKKRGRAATLRRAGKIDLSGFSLQAASDVAQLVGDKFEAAVMAALQELLKELVRDGSLWVRFAKNPHDLEAILILDEERVENGPKWVISLPALVEEIADEAEYEPEAAIAVRDVLRSLADRIDRALATAQPPPPSG